MKSLNLAKLTLLSLLFSSIALADGPQLPPLGIQDEGGTQTTPVIVLNCTGDGIACTHDTSTGVATLDVNTSAGSGDITSVGTTTSGAAGTVASATEATFRHLSVPNLGSTGAGDGTFTRVNIRTAGTSLPPAFNAATGLIVSRTAGAANHSNIALISGNTGAGNVYFGDTDSEQRGVVRYDHSDNSLQLMTNATEVMRLTSSNNVGIGSTAPTHKLHVDGSITATTATFLSLNSTRIGDTTASDATFEKIRINNPTVAADAINIVPFTNNSGIQIRETDNGNIAGRFHSNASKGALDLYTAGTLAIKFDAANSADNFINAGKLGVGNNAPSEILHVTGNILTSGMATFTGGINATNIGSVTEAEATFKELRAKKTGSVAAVLEVTGSYSATLGSDATGTYLFNNSSARKLSLGTGSSRSNLVIDTSANSGNVGVNTTNPTHRLHVDGTFVASGQATFGSLVGIGTSAPEATFEILSTTAAVSQFMRGTGNSDYVSALRLAESSATYQGGYFNYDGAANKFIIGVHDAADELAASDIESIIIDRATGSVGIANTSPVEKIDITGNIKTSGLATFTGGINATKIGASSSADATFTSITVPNARISGAEATFTSMASASFSNSATGEYGITKTCTSAIVVKGGIIVSCS